MSFTYRNLQTTAADNAMWNAIGIFTACAAFTV